MKKKAITLYTYKKKKWRRTFTLLLKSHIKRPTSTEEQVTPFVKVLVKETDRNFFASGFQMNNYQGRMARAEL